MLHSTFSSPKKSSSHVLVCSCSVVWLPSLFNPLPRPAHFSFLQDCQNTNTCLPHLFAWRSRQISPGPVLTVTAIHSHPHPTTVIAGLLPWRTNTTYLSRVKVPRTMATAIGPFASHQQGTPRNQAISWIPRWVSNPRGYGCIIAKQARDSSCFLSNFFVIRMAREHNGRQPSLMATNSWLLEYPLSTHADSLRA